MGGGVMREASPLVVMAVGSLGLMIVTVAILILAILDRPGTPGWRRVE